MCLGGCHFKKSEEIKKLAKRLGYGSPRIIHLSTAGYQKQKLQFYSRDFHYQPGSNCLLRVKRYLL
jgi:hypothetical protein